MSKGELLNLSMNPADVVSEIVTGITDYLSVKESNETERQRIQAMLDVATKIIENDIEKFKLYINNEYKDKDRLYTNAERLLDKGMSENNIQIINTACNFMIGVFNKNPLLDYKSDIDFTKGISSFHTTDFSRLIED